MDDCNLCQGSGKMFPALKNGNPCVRCGGYGSFSHGSANPGFLTTEEERQVRIEQGN